MSSQNNRQQQQQQGYSAALSIPCLPSTHPTAPSPPSLALPLHPHQQRALHRCLLIEQDGSLSTGFNALPSRYGDYTSRGGVLADAVGTGKTATMIALTLASGGVGATLVVAPGHLIPQWKAECAKFAPGVEVCVGEAEHVMAGPVLPKKKRRIVLVDIADVLGSTKVWYDAFRRVYSGGRDITSKVGREMVERYRAQARFCVQSPRGPCSYDGWVYTSKLHMPTQPWRRVVYDEIQDLIEDGTESQKNLVQLSRNAGNVWLMSATPFPHGNKSVTANHEMLGFKRLKLDVESEGRLSSCHPFEKIKAKLYVRSPQSVADEAVVATASVNKQTVTVVPRDIEKTFYGIAYGKGMAMQTNSALGDWDPSFHSCRQLTVHPEASEDLRKQLAANRSSSSSSSSSSSTAAVNRVGRYASVDSFARQSLNAARSRLRDLQSSDYIPRLQVEVKDTKKSLEVAEKVKNFRENDSRAANPFAAVGNADASDTAAMQREANVIHDYFCACCRADGPYSCSRADGNAVLRLVRERNRFNSPIGPEFTKGSINSVIEHFATGYCRVGATKQAEDGSSRDALDHYISITKRSLTGKTTSLNNMQKEADNLTVQIEALAKSTAESRAARAAARGNDDIAAANGSKPAALIQYLEENSGDRHIVFSMWHDVLRLVQQTLNRNGIECVFCHGSNDNMQAAIGSFTSGKVNVILLSARAKASGANLQCASHVIFLDPPGEHADHGATLEKQAIGRAVRMGQDKPVTVTRFCVEGTLEAALYSEIDRASSRITKRDDDQTYTITEGTDTMLARQVTIESADMGQDQDEEEDDDGIEHMETSTEEDRIKRRMEEARLNGTVIEVDDEDGDDSADAEESSSPPNKRAKNTHPIATPRVKTEGPVNTGGENGATARVSPEGVKKSSSEGSSSATVEDDNIIDLTLD